MKEAKQIEVKNIKAMKFRKRFNLLQARIDKLCDTFSLDVLKMYLIDDEACPLKMLTKLIYNDADGFFEAGREYEMNMIKFYIYDNQDKKLFTLNDGMSHLHEIMRNKLESVVKGEAK